MNAERGFICQYRDPGKQQHYYNFPTGDSQIIRTLA